MKKRWLVILSCVGVLVLAAGSFFYFAQEKIDDVLAVVNGEKIHVSDFRPRYKEYLKVGDIKDNLETRNIILQDMIDEILMRGDARAQGWDKGREYEYEAEKATTQVLLDTYAHRALIDTITVSEDEIKHAFARVNTKVSVRHLYAKTEKEAWELKKLLDGGESFESLAKKVFRDPRLANNGGYLGYIGWGDTDPNFEDAAYSLPVGTVSNPVKTDQGYSILRVDKKVAIPLASESDYLLQKKNIAMQLRYNKLNDEGTKLTRGLIDEKQVSFNADMLNAVIARWKDLESYEPLELVQDSSKMMADIGKNVLVTYPGGSWTIREFLYKMSFTADQQRQKVEGVDDLKQFVLGLLSRETIVSRAKQAGYLSEAGVQSSIQKRTDYFLFSKWRKLAIDSVHFQDSFPSGLNGLEQKEWAARHEKQEKKIRQMFDSHNEIYRYPDEVRIKEIYLLSSADAQSLLQRLMKGEEFSMLARKYSKRVWSAVKGGDMGFHTSAEYGALGDKIFSAKPGTVIGPVPLDSGYSIIKVQERRNGKEKTYEEAKYDIAEELRTSWENIAFVNALQKLQQKSSVVVDREKLKRLPYIDPELLVQGE